MLPAASCGRLLSRLVAVHSPKPHVTGTQFSIANRTAALGVEAAPSTSAGGHVPSAAYPEDTLYSSQHPPHYASPGVSVALLPGKGRGLIASTPFSLGQLVMAAQPLAIRHGPCDIMPEPSGLLPQLQQATASSPAAAAWLQLLHTGTGVPTGISTTVDADRHLQALQQLLHQPITQNAKESSTDEGIGPHQGRAIADADLEGVIAYNAFGDSYEDFAAFEYRRTVQSSSSTSTSTSPGDATESDSHEATNVDGDAEATPSSQVGIWPAFSLLNHSCTPNCVHYVVGSTMVVRAVQDVPAGQELTVSYLGREDFSPASIRQQLLNERFGFVCNCPRCQLEQHLPQSTKTLLKEVHDAAHQVLRPTLLMAIQDEDMQALQQVGKQLVDWSVKLHDELQRLRDTIQQQQQQGEQQQGQGQAQTDPPLQGPVQQQQQNMEEYCALLQAVASVGGLDVALLHVEATVYDFIELLQQHAQLMQDTGQGEEVDTVDGHGVGMQDPLASLQLCADIMHAVSKGSELHVFQACRLLELSMQPSSPLGQQGAVGYAQAAEEALLARYGRVSPEVMLQLARHSARIAKDYIAS